MTARINPPSPEHRPSFRLALLHPKYLGVWLSMPLFILLAFLPFRWRDAVAVRLGRVVGRRARRSRRRAEINLRLCFPQWSEQRRQRLVDEMFELAAISLLSGTTLLVRSRRWLERHIKLVGEEHLKPYLGGDKPLIFVVPHTWFVDFPGLLLASRGYPMTTMVNPQKNEATDYLMQKARSRFGGKIFGRGAGIHSLLGAIKEGFCAYYLPDQDHGQARSEYVPLFASHKATLPCMGKMLNATGGVIFPMAATYDRSRGQFRGVIRPAITEVAADRAADARRLNQEIEALIGDDPAQYMWILKFFKSQPPGTPDPYAR
ncbi:lauroyl-Kdo(2)-lipid IV(A) myristoyltransferase [Ferrimonas sediminicola]|uniref:Lipid A biosynthesis acyltransferase n=1 Tax=Ferrimonas sediminicola TaxID=2569538 RepID=A0A4U1BBX0_9GAMM|nr:lauroyl-Kdo(2)-lipid IV(A) myristoyltransferase [Ferrimonas sediminicola]TKB48488.1 lauroyl-Kdo(2)-lipid IV(A) myristoyltransferase [Ferrimonas sediminicola]